MYHINFCIYSMWNILIGCLPVDGTTNAVAEEKYDSEENGEPKSKDNDKNDDASNFVLHIYMSLKKVLELNKF